MKGADLEDVTVVAKARPCGVKTDTQRTQLRKDDLDCSLLRLLEHVFMWTWHRLRTNMGCSNSVAQMMGCIPPLC